MEIAGQPKEVWNRSETVWNCRKAAISADPIFIWKLLASPKRFETGLKPSETVGKQLYLLILHIYMEIAGQPKEVWNRSETVWNCRKAAVSADPTFIWKLLASPKRSETGLKPSETVGKQLCLLILHLYGNCWPAQRGLKQVWNRLKL